MRKTKITQKKKQRKITNNIKRKAEAETIKGSGKKNILEMIFRMLHGFGYPFGFWGTFKDRLITSPTPHLFALFEKFPVYALTCLSVNLYFCMKHFNFLSRRTFSRPCKFTRNKAEIHKALLLSGVNFIWKIIQIWGVKLAAQISHVKFLSRRVIKKILSKDSIDLFYVTLCTKSNHPKMYNYTTYST